MRQSTVKIVQGEEPVATEVLAEAIVRISDAAKQLLNAGLTQRALAILLQDATGVTRGDIHKILDALPELRRTYTKK